MPGAERNRLVENRVGFSIGHRDVENLVVENVVEGAAATTASTSGTRPRGRFLPIETGLPGTNGSTMAGRKTP